jgi:hypothetical protein
VFLQAFIYGKVRKEICRVGISPFIFSFHQQYTGAHVYRKLPINLWQEKLPATNETQQSIPPQCKHKSFIPHPIYNGTFNGTLPCLSKNEVEKHY